MIELLQNLMAHMRWADARVADALEHDATPDADATRLFAHVASVEHLWYARIHSQVAAYPVWPTLDVAAARAIAAEHADLFDTLLADATTDPRALTREVRYRSSAGRDYRGAVTDIITHVAMHGSHHRGQIARQLRAAGREPPYVDYIEFTRRDQAG